MAEKNKPLKLNEGEIQEYLNYVRSTEQGKKYSKEQWAEYTKFVRDTYSRSAKDIVLDAGLRSAANALNAYDTIAAAPLRVAAAAGYQALNPEDDILRMGEIKEAFTPFSGKTFPGMDEIMARAGVDEGAQFSDVVPVFEDEAGNRPAWMPNFIPRDIIPDKGGWLDFNLRGAGGFAQDAALDAGNLVSFGGAGVARRAAQDIVKETLAKRAARVAKDIVTAPSTMARKMGSGLFDMGVDDLIVAGEKKGKKEVGKTLRRLGVRGSARAIRRRADEAADMLSDDIINPTLEKAGAAGARFDKERGFDPFFQKVSTMSKPFPEGTQRLTLEEGDALIDDLTKRYVRGENPTPAVATQWKSDIGEGLPGSAWDSLAGRDTGADVAKTLYLGVRDEIEDSVGRSLGVPAKETLHQANADLGVLLSLRKAMAQGAQKEAKKPIVTAMDTAMMFGGTGLGGPLFGATAAATKKGLDISRMPAVRTGLGFWMNRLGETPWSATLLDAATRRAILDRAGLLSGEELPNGQEQE